MSITLDKSRSGGFKGRCHQENLSGAGTNFV
jgi:hypothetical protein